MNNTTIEFCPESGQVVAGKKLKNGQWGSGTANVTEDSIEAVFQYLVQMKTTNDSGDVYEREGLIFRGNKGYKVEIHLKVEKQ
jgi:hypothetical protein